jgi:hypothetical protein
LIASKFKDAYYLRIYNIRVAPKGIGSVIIYGCIAGPFTDVGKMAGNVFKGVLFLMFLEIWLEVTYGAYALIKNSRCIRFNQKFKMHTF